MRPSVAKLLKIIRKVYVQILRVKLKEINGPNKNILNAHW